MPVDLLLAALTHQLRCECNGLTWLLRVRGISVRFRRRSLRNGYYVHGQQQARKLSNPNERETVTRYIELAAFRRWYRNGCGLNSRVSSDWRTSLVPAPAVIPAPRAYVEVVEIKTLVVRMLSYLANTGRKNFFKFFDCHWSSPGFLVTKIYNSSLKKGGCRAIERLLAKSVSACFSSLQKGRRTS